MKKPLNFAENPKKKRKEKENRPKVLNFPSRRESVPLIIGVKLHMPECEAR